AGGTSATQTFAITVNWVNQPPSFNKIADQNIIENARSQTVNFSGITISQVTNEPSRAMTFHVSNDNSNLFSVQPGVSANGTLTYTPAANAFGAANLTVYLTDDAGGTSATQNFAITVNWVNQPPTLNAIGNVNLVENWSLQTVNLSGITAG